jgi:hypothetical protein
MDKNVLSPEQLKTLQVFQYNEIKEIKDASLNQANQGFSSVLATLSGQNSILQKNVTNLQSILDSVVSQPSKGNEELIEEIKWNTYFYKKYSYQTHIMVVIIGFCIVINLLHGTVSKPVFVAGVGFILSIVFIYVFYILWDLTGRDNQNFDEYSFYNYKGEYVKSNFEHTNAIDASNCIVRKLQDRYE